MAGRVAGAANAPTPAGGRAVTYKFWVGRAGAGNGPFFFAARKTKKKRKKMPAITSANIANAKDN
jgi:hypothetical protein